jgi:quinol monooxygenase YgiN
MRSWQEPNVLRVSELWENQESLDAHMQTEHMAAFKQVLDNAKIEEMKIEALDSSNLRQVM